MREEWPAVQQGTMILPYFDDEVPVVDLSDGTRYIPVVALCRVLGLRPRTHIPRWRRLFLWEHTRTLPLRTEKRGTRMVWCLHLGALLFWCSSFNWSLVSPERQMQLQEATDAGLKHREQAHQEMLTRYRLMRHLLFRFLTNYADAQTQLQQVAARLHPRLDAVSSAALDALLEKGCALINETTVHARAILQDQASNPIMDVVTIDAEGNATQVGTQPLFPVIPEQDEEQFFAKIDRLTHWYGDCFLFLAEHGLPSQKNHAGEEQEKCDDRLLDSEPRKRIHESTRESMTSDDLQRCLDLRRADLDPELFAAAVALHSMLGLIAAGGGSIERPDEEEVLSPHHLEAFLARAVETAQKTKRFEQEWRRLHRLIPQIQTAWECGQALFQEDVVHATSNPEEMEYLSQIDFAESCYAAVDARKTSPHDQVLQAWSISGYMLAWWQHFLAEEDASV